MSEDIDKPPIWGQLAQFLDEVEPLADRTSATMETIGARMFDPEYAKDSVFDVLSSVDWLPYDDATIRGKIESIRWFHGEMESNEPRNQEQRDLVKRLARAYDEWQAYQEVYEMMIERSRESGSKRSDEVGRGAIDDR